MKELEIRRFPDLDYGCNEALNTLCSNLSYCGSNVKTIMITSRYAMEGKTFVAMNLMRSLAALQKKVVLVDMDLRRSSIQSRFSLHFREEEHMGLVHYLAGMCRMDDVIYETGIPNAHMVPVGRDVANSLPLLNTPEMPQLMAYLREHYDVVLIDTPPAGMIVDALDVAKHCDGALIVVSYKRGKRREIADLKDSIDRTGCRILGVVMNNVEFRSLSSRRYYYHSEKYAYRYRQYEYRAGREEKKRFRFGKK